jgi:dTMP kinase
MEEQDFSFHQRVRSEYLALAAEFPERIRVVDASQSIDSVHANILEILQQWEML